MGKGFAALLVSLVEPILGRILAALGIGIISYTGFSIVLNQLESAIQNNLNGVGSDVAAILGLAGMGQALGIIFGGFTARIALQAISKLGVLKK